MSNPLKSTYDEKLPIGWEQDGLGMGMWSGMSRVQRVMWSPVYLLLMVSMWFRGCFLGQDYHFIPTREYDVAQTSQTAEGEE